MSDSYDRGERTGADTPLVDVTLIDEMLKMSAAERLRQNDRMAALVVMTRSAFGLGDWEWKSPDT
jgi:hypothetical protein